MANRNAWISPKMVKDNGIIQINVNDKLIQSAILTTQEIYLTQILGFAFYNEINEAVALKIEAQETGGTYEIPADLQSVIDQAKMYLVWGATKDFLTANTYKLTNKGLVTLSDANSSPINESELANFQDIVGNKFDDYKRILINFLKANKFPVGNIAANTSNSSNGGVYLRNRNKGCGNSTNSGGSPDARYYTKTEIDAKLDAIYAKFLLYYTKTETDALIEALRQEIELNYYNKTEIDDIIANIDVDLTNYYDKDQVDDLLQDKIDVLNGVAKGTLTVDKIIEIYDVNNPSIKTTITPTGIKANDGLTNMEVSLDKIELSDANSNFFFKPGLSGCFNVRTYYTDGTREAYGDLYSNPGGGFTISNKNFSNETVDFSVSPGGGMVFSSNTANYYVSVFMGNGIQFFTTRSIQMNSNQPFTVNSPLIQLNAVDGITLDTDNDNLLIKTIGSSESNLSTGKLTGNRKHYLPDANGTLLISVNGQVANDQGNISLPTFYEQDGTITGNRTVDLNSNELIFKNYDDIYFYTDDNVSNGRYIQISNSPNGPKLELYGVSTGLGNTGISYLEISNNEIEHYLESFIAGDPNNNYNVKFESTNLSIERSYFDYATGNNTRYVLGNNQFNMFHNDTIGGNEFSVSAVGGVWIANRRVSIYTDEFTLGGKSNDLFSSVIKVNNLSENREQYLPDSNGTLVSSVNNIPADNEGNVEVFAKFPQVTYAEKMAMTGMTDGQYVFQTDAGKGLFYWNAAQNRWNFGGKSHTHFIDGRYLTDFTLDDEDLGKDLLFIIPDFPSAFEVNFHMGAGALPPTEEVKVIKYGWGKLIPIVAPGVQVICSDGSSYTDLFARISANFSITYVATDYVFIRVF